MESFETNPNQKIVRIKKRECGKDNVYTLINLESLNYAMTHLTNAQMKVWLYFVKNVDGYELAVSPAEAAKKWNIKKTTMQETVRFFIENKYLVQAKEGSNKYIFYDYPLE